MKKYHEDYENSSYLKYYQKEDIKTLVVSRKFEDI